MPPESASKQDAAASTSAVQAPAGYALSAEKTAQAIAYDRAAHQVYWFDIVFSFGILLALLHFRVAARFRDWAERTTESRFMQAAIFVPAFQVSFALLKLPGDAVYHQIRHYFGLSIQSWAAWLADQAKGNFVSIFAEIFLVWLVYALIRYSPRRWWVYVWLGALPVVLFSEFVNPVLIDPLFFQYQPLVASHPEIAHEIERVLVRSGHPLPEDRIFVMDASRKYAELNAGLTGVGASQRVVIWDTTVKHMTTPEIMFVFGHEMGHYALGHLVQEMVFSEILMLAGLWGGFYLIEWLLRRFGPAWAIRDVADWASFPVLLLLLFLYGFVCTPAINAFSRHCEHEADQYGLEIVHELIPNSSQVAAHAFQILGQENLEEPEPSPIVEWWFYNHPAMAERIQFANTYNPWGTGQSPRYVK